MNSSNVSGVEVKLQIMQNFMNEAFDQRDKAQARIERLEEALKMSMGMANGHRHWDETMQHGAGCPLCIEQREIKDKIREILTPPDKQ